MITERLYYEDAYKKEFTATVLACREGKKGFEVVLSATAFYPEGGGQPYDRGILWPDAEDAAKEESLPGADRAGAASGMAIDTVGPQVVQVLEVHEKNGELIHYTDAPLSVGLKIRGKIDWGRRFDLMQQHSGEHIISGLVHAAYGYDNVGFHMGSDVITIDFNGELDEAAMRQLEAQANAIIWQNQKTHIFYPSPEELQTLPYRSKKELTGDVRIVEFPRAQEISASNVTDSSPAEESGVESAASGSMAACGAVLSYVDLCACCGTHVAYAGEIGMIKLLSVVKFRDGVRMEMICGGRALNYLNMVNAQNHQISVLLSAKPDRTAEAVKRNMDENFRLKGRVLALEEKLFAQEAERLADTGNVLLFEKDMDSDSVRKLAVAVMATCGGRCAVFSDNGDGSFKYAVGEKDGDLRTFVKEMNRTLNGRGGGKPFFAQGSLKAGEDEIRKFFEEG
ncbi:MAG: DHHA1 domain-containing protein [Lachnospiraceae bacterium]|nr:DHHA1 domain-containing protein [Lachnospiraceae bacterium]